MKTSDLIGPALDCVVAQCAEVDCEEPYHPSTDWSQGGPIIEREGLALRQWGDEWTCEFSQGKYRHFKSGPTPLIAACRCYVASKLGDKVEIPEELK